MQWWSKLKSHKDFVEVDSAEALTENEPMTVIWTRYGEYKVQKIQFLLSK